MYVCAMFDDRENHKPRETPESTVARIILSLRRRLLVKVNP